MKRGMMLMAVLAIGAVVGAQNASAQEGRPEGRPEGFGPPLEVIQAWMEGRGFELPGPPAWIAKKKYEARANAPEGFGPPAEIVEAWRSGRGFELTERPFRPGPPWMRWMR